MYDEIAFRKFAISIFFVKRGDAKGLTRSIIDSMNICETCQISYKEQVIKQLNRAGLFLFSERRRVVSDNCNLANVSTGLEIIFLIKGSIAAVAMMVCMPSFLLQRSGNER